MQYEIIDTITNKVINSIEWDGVSGNPIPNSCIGIPRDTVNGSGIGWEYINGQFKSPPPPTPIIPTVVSRFQARAALVQAGYFDQVDAYMASLPRTDIKRMAWEDAEGFDRTSTTLQAVAQMLNLDSAGLDALFVLAASIQA